MKRVSMLVFVLMLAACDPALAIPPPWTLEAAKAGADVVLIAKTAKIEPVQGVRGVNAKVGLEPVEVLKGKLEPTAKDARPFLLYARPKRQAGPGGIERRVIGGTGQPAPQEGQTALLFLRRDRIEPDGFRAVCGSFGYVVLSAASQQGREAVKKRIRMHADWCAKIGDAEARKAMEGYYAKASAFVAGQEPKKTP